MTTPPVYYLNVSIRGYATEVLVNRAPVCRSPVDAPYMVIPSVSEWMISGVNEIAVEVHAVDTTSPPDPDSPRRILVQLCVGTLGEMVEPGSEQVLCEIRHDPAALPPRSPPPRRLAQSHTLADWPRWAWQDSPVFPEDDATDEELYTFLESLHGDLADGRIDAVIARERVKFAEVAPLYGSSPAEAAALTREQFAELASLASWSVAPIDRDEVVLRRCCDGRVVELIDRNDRAVLRSGPTMEDVAAWSLYVFVARVRGLLEIVR